MKKFSRTHIVAALIALLVIIGGVSVGVSAEDEKIYSERYFKYIIENEQVTIIDYFGSESEVVIYDHIASLPVTRIRGQIFRSNHALTKVTIPDTVTQIDSDLFTGLPNLKTVVVQSKSITVKVPEGCTIVEDYPIYIDPGKIDTGSAAVTTTPAPVTLPPAPVTTTTPAETTTARVGFEDAAGDADDTTTAVTTPPAPDTTTPAPVTTAPVTTPEVTTSDTVPADTSTTEPSGTTSDTAQSDTTPSGTSSDTTPSGATSSGTTPAAEPGTTTPSQKTSGDDSNGVNVVVIVVVAVVVVAAAVVGISASLKRSKRS